MSRILAKTLNESEIVVGSMISKLESLSGFESRDIRLLAEVSAVVRQKTAALGLDPKDTTPKELFYALKNRFERDCQLIEKTYTAQTDIQRFKKIAKAAADSQKPREVWVLKGSTVKKILRSNPPRALIKSLNYRSLESMLKHEEAELLLAGAVVASSANWREKLDQQYAKLSSLDFENRAPRVVVPKTKKWQDAIPAKQAASALPQMGAVVIWQSPAAARLSSLTLLTICTQSLDNIYKNNLVLKSYQTQRDFGYHAQQIWSNRASLSAAIAGVGLEWRSLLHHLSKQPAELFPETLEPHILPENLSHLSISRLLASMHPQLNWWRECDYILLGQGRNQASLNIVDAAINRAKSNAFGGHSVDLGRQSLWDELISRYLDHPNVFDRTVAELEMRSSPYAAVRAEALSV